MLCREWRQITSNGITRSANFTRNNKLLSVGEWKRRVLLPPSHFVDSLTPTSKNSVCLQCGNQIDNADKASFSTLRLLRDKNFSPCYCSIAMTSPVEFSSSFKRPNRDQKKKFKRTLRKSSVQVAYLHSAAHASPNFQILTVCTVIDDEDEPISARKIIMTIIVKKSN